MRVIGLILIFLFSSYLYAEQFGNWIAIDGYKAVASHEKILIAAKEWAAKERDHKKYRYNYEYKIAKKKNGYAVAVTIVSYSKTTQPGYFPGGHFVLFINEQGEVYDVFNGA